MGRDSQKMEIQDKNNSYYMAANLMNNKSNQH